MKDTAKKSIDKVNRGRIKLIATLLVIAAIISFTLNMHRPNTDTATFCEVYKREKSRLSKLPGDSWPSGLFNMSIGDAGEFSRSFEKLEKVAPKDIAIDIQILKKAYATISNDPSMAINVSIGASDADAHTANYIKKSCSSNGV